MTKEQLLYNQGLTHLMLNLWNQFEAILEGMGSVANEISIHDMMAVREECFVSPTITPVDLFNAIKWTGEKPSSNNHVLCALYQLCMS